MADVRTTSSSFISGTCTAHLSTQWVFTALRSSRSLCLICPHRRQSSSSARPLDKVPRPIHSLSGSSSRTEYGQPLPTSHPHLFPSFDTTLPFPSLLPERKLPLRYSYHSSLENDNGQIQLTPGIVREEYEQRRRKLMDQVEDGGVVLVMSGRVKYMSGQIL